VNGVQQTLTFATPNFPTATSTDSSSFRIGASSTAAYTDGSVGNVRIYLASLTQGQVYTDMCGYLPIAPLGNWPLGMASPEPDLSGNGYAGTLVNAPAIADHCPTKCFTSMGVGR
jgi:hypothetical protein